MLKKTWKVKNLGSRAWPADSRLVSVTDDLYFYPAEITYFLSPGDIMEIGIRIYIPKDERADDSLKEYIVRMYSKDLSWFGEPMIATVQLDTELYTQTMNSLPKDSDELKYPRVTDEKKYLENYEIAKELLDNKNWLK